MMTIDFRKFSAQKKYEGDMEFEYSAPDSLIDIPFVKFGTPIKVRFSYELFEDDSLEIRGSVAFRLEGQCSRCLKETSTDIVGELDAYFQPTKDCEDYSYSNGIVDLKKAVEEAVMASLPFTLSCKEECEPIRFSSDDTVK